MLIAAIFEIGSELVRRRGREASAVALLLLGASCVPLRASEAPPLAAAAHPEMVAVPAAAAAPAAPEATPRPEELVADAAPTSEAAAINASIPLSAERNPRAASIVFRARTAGEQQRALQCLAEAVYFEARSESEDGQRAVAQVVLNRVRHPSYPASVCGVVYQGPMRAGGGCQFTFTCDGSLAHAPSGPSWQRARAVAAAALAGSVYAPVGHATHYHTHEVVPHWAWKLAKVAVVGSHNFYRVSGAWGAPSAFSAGYAGREPAAAAVMATRLPASVPGRTSGTAPKLPVPLLPAAGSAAVAIAGAEPPAAPAADDRLPTSGVRDEFLNSGRWRDAPAGS